MTTPDTVLYSLCRVVGCTDGRIAMPMSFHIEEERRVKCDACGMEYEFKATPGEGRRLDVTIKAIPK